MGYARAYQIRDTPLTWAIRSMRRRLRLGQERFTELVLGRAIPGLVSRWESGQITPRKENLLRLLKLAATSQEQAIIIEALKARGIEISLGSLQQVLAAAGIEANALGDGDVEAPGLEMAAHGASIAPSEEGRNGGGQLSGSPEDQAADAAPAGPVLPEDRATSYSSRRATNHGTS
jgi:hypothetical protein